MGTHLRRAVPHASISTPTIDDAALIPQSVAKLLAGDVSDMTFWRWRKAGLIPELRKIRGRNYWRRSEFLSALEAAAEKAINLNNETAEGRGCGHEHQPSPQPLRGGRGRIPDTGRESRTYPPTEGTDHLQESRNGRGPR